MSVLAAILVGLEIVCLHMPDPFTAIGLHYRDFHQVPDSEVVQFLDEADARRAGQNGGRGTRSPQRALGGRSDRLCERCGNRRLEPRRSCCNIRALSCSGVVV